MALDHGNRVEAVDPDIGAGRIHAPGTGTVTEGTVGNHVEIALALAADDRVEAAAAPARFRAGGDFHQFDGEVMARAQGTDDGKNRCRHGSGYPFASLHRVGLSLR